MMGSIGVTPDAGSENGQVEPMTKAERLELAKVVRMTARVAREDVEARKAELLADAEEQLAAEYRADDPRWAELTRLADAECRRVDELLAAACRDAGIRDEFRPKVVAQWYRRGENAASERRSELRKVAVTRLDATAKRAKAAISAEEARLCTDLATRALGTSEAHAFLAALPTPEALMPPLVLHELEAEVTR